MRPGIDEVLIEIFAAGVNRADLLQAAGNYPPPPGASDILGLEVSGRIGAFGDGVSEWIVGQEVCALLAGGGYAESVIVPAAQVLPVPSGVTVHDAAALPEVACTVWSNLVMAAHLTPGEVLLVPVFLMSGTWWMSWSSVLLILWLGLATTTLAYVLFGMGFRSLQPGHIATLNLAEPVFATLLGVFVLGEVLGPLGVLGCALVIVGLGLLGLVEGRSTS